MHRSPLFAKLQAAGAQFAEYQGWEVPASFGSLETEYRALKEAAGLLDLSHRGRLSVSGEDAPRFLHGMVTNEVQDLPPGQGNYAFLLDVHGHILADLHVFRVHEERYLLDCDPDRAAVILGALDRHIISDVVDLEDRGPRTACLGVEGPCAREALSEAIGFDPPHMRLLEHMEVTDLGARLVRASLSGEEGYWVYSSPEQIMLLWDRIREVGSGFGVLPAGFGAVEVCRVEAGIPRYGSDITEKSLPQETGQMQALSFTKGCYIGQETVERIRSRGHVNRRLVGLLLDGAEPVLPGTPLLAGGETVGSITSSARSFHLQRIVALGYVRREHAETGTLLAAGEVPAEVSPLPFFAAAPRT